MHEAPVSARLVAFSDFEVNLKACELRRQGRAIPLSQEAGWVLAMLLERPGQVVKGEEFRVRIWPNRSAAEFERALSEAIDSLRQALKDSAEKPLFVRRVAGQDYRFICPLEVSQEEISTAPLDEGFSPPPVSTRNMTGILVSHFRISEEIKESGMGIVYRAQDTRTPRWVALKFPTPELCSNRKALQRFEREARTATSLNHPNICTIYEVDHFEGIPFIAMELLEGETLEKHLSGRPLALRETIRISIQVASALEAAHDKGIIHRDIKPGNVFITRKGLAKVLDFGLAKSIRESDDGDEAASPDLETRVGNEGSLTASGEAIGTAGYMSPEQLRGEKLDPRTDLFSFGAVLYEMATGKHAFSGRTTYEICAAIINSDPEPVRRVNPEIPPEFDVIVRKALQKDRSKRHTTAGHLRSELEALAEAKWVPLPYWIVVLRRLAWPLAGLAVAAGMTVAALSPNLRQQFLMRFWPPPLPAKRSVAVLPFKAAGGGAESQAYCRGLSEAATDKLTLLTAGRNLQVTPAREVTKRSPDSLEAVRTELGSNLAFEGSCTQAGNLVRIAFRMVDTGTLRALRTASIGGDISRPFELHKDVVEGMIGMLGIELSALERQTLASHGTQVPGAYSYYLLGRGLLVDNQRKENLEKAISLFERALELDRNYAHAFAGLGIAFWEKYEMTKEPSWVETARLSCERSSALDPKLPAAHICTGIILNGTGEHERARAAFQRALELEPTSDEAYRGLAFAQEQLGQFAEAEQTFLKAIQLRPDYWPGYSWLGGFYYRQARYAEAAKMWEKVVELAPQRFVAYSDVGATYLSLGQYDKAIEWYDRSIALRPMGFSYANLSLAHFLQKRYSLAARYMQKAVELDPHNYRYWGDLGEAYYWSPGERSKSSPPLRRAIALAKEQLTVNERDVELLGLLAIDYALLGQSEEARAHLQRARVLSPHSAHLEYRAAIVHARLNEIDKVYECLERAVAWGTPPKIVQDSPNFADLHADPRFQLLVNKH